MEDTILLIHSETMVTMQGEQCIIAECTVREQNGMHQTKLLCMPLNDWKRKKINTYPDNYSLRTSNQKDCVSNLSVNRK